MLENLLQGRFGLDAFRPGQKEIISAIIDKKDALAVLPTGGGKSLCYQYPAIYLNQLVVVISPLIALMKDQVAGLVGRGIPSGCICSGQTEDEKIAIFNKMNCGGAFVLYLSPERVQKPGFQKWILKREIALFAVDEAHCVSQWGHDFRKEYSELSVLKTLRPDVPTLALTASATPLVLEDISKNLNLKNPVQLVHGFYRNNLYYQVEICSDEESKLQLVIEAIRQFPVGRIIIYCGTRRATEELSVYLQERFESVGYYHAGLPSNERTRIQDAYVSSSLRILVATNAFGMGIDQPNVRLVIHFQMPANIDALYQEMGRAGRDGQQSTCLLLFAKKDKALQSYFLMNSKASGPIKDLKWKNLETLVSYAEASECRHAEILTYYKDSTRLKVCGHCDVCDPKSARRVMLRAKKNENFQHQTKLRSKTKRSKPDSDLVLDESQEARFQALRRWRKNKSLELDVPAFVILGDQSLRELAVQNPNSVAELKKVYGFGDVKVEKFGWDILAELQLF